ncbi:MAG: foldase [Faecalibacterium sp.]
MKQKLFALVCALALTLNLAGCTLSTPDSVGTLGAVEISSGLYLLAQYNAYQQAAQFADEDQDSSNVKSYLKQTITVDGESILVSDYVADETLKSLQYLAAVESRFEELGGALTDEQTAQADSYAQQLMDQYGETYTANGIGLETLKRYERALSKSSLLLELVYSENGESPLSDAELTSHLENEMYMLGYTVVPLYDLSTFTFADETQAAQMLEMAQKLAGDYNASDEDKSSASGQLTLFSALADAALPDIYGVIGGSYDAASSGLQTDLLSSGTLDSAFTQEGAADAVRSLQYGQAAAIQYTSYAILIGVRVDPLELSSLDDYRSDVLYDMASQDLSDSLTEYGTQLADGLDRSAMKKLPASKISAE